MTNNIKSFSTIGKKNVFFEWLVSDNDFELVFTKGGEIISQDKKVKAKYIFTTECKAKTIKIGLSIASKKGNSVWRNKIKRLLRESIRTEREKLLRNIQQNNSDILIVFSPHSINQINSKKIFLKDIKPAILEIFSRIGKITQVQSKTSAE